MSSEAGFRRVLRRFERCVREDEMRGCGHPDNWDAIEEAYGKAKDAILAYVVRVASRAARNSDLDVAIGEHAFAAGFNECAKRLFKCGDNDFPDTLAQAWSDYTPPEDLCGGGQA